MIGRQRLAIAAAICLLSINVPYARATAAPPTIPSIDQISALPLTSAISVTNVQMPPSGPTMSAAPEPMHQIEYSETDDKKIENFLTDKATETVIIKPISEGFGEFTSPFLGDLYGTTLKWASGALGSIFDLPWSDVFEHLGVAIPELATDTLMTGLGVFFDSSEIATDEQERALAYGYSNGTNIFGIDIPPVYEIPPIEENPTVPPPVVSPPPPPPPSCDDDCDCSDDCYCDDDDENCDDLDRARFISGIKREIRPRSHIASVVLGAIRRADAPIIRRKLEIAAASHQVITRAKIAQKIRRKNG